MTYQEARSQMCSENDSFAVSFIHLELRRKHKEDFLKVGKSKVLES